MAETERQMPASHFKARCLAILDDVEATGVGILITKRGRPVARLVPLEHRPAASLIGSVSWQDDEDLIAPEEERWDADA